MIRRAYNGRRWMRARRRFLAAREGWRHRRLLRPPTPQPCSTSRSNRPRECSRAPTKVPQPLLDQLKEGGRMVIPIGDRFNQKVHLIIKQDGKRVDRELKPTLFVPMTGRDQEEAAAARRAGKSSAKANPQDD